MTGYIYEILDNSGKSLGWWPYDTTKSATFAYTLYLSDPTVGIEKAENPSSTFTLFPNPSSGSVTMKFRDTYSGQVDIILTDLMGRLVKVISQGQSITTDYALNFKVSDLAQGIYLVTLQNEGLRLTRKLLVSR